MPNTKKPTKIDAELDQAADGVRPTRRGVIGGALGGMAALTLSPALRAQHAPAKTPGKPMGFTHGVASGDPTQDRVVIWTRFVADKPKRLTWEISTSPSFQDEVNKGRIEVSEKTDWTAKVDVGGLLPGKTYYFAFRTGRETSVVGRTRTLPKTTHRPGPTNRADRMRLAVVSCSNYPQGHFHVYREIAQRPVDLVLHLGDYLYEYEAGRYSNPEVTKQGRTVEPKTELVGLDDYRTRYALYRSDPDLQAVHRQHPFICVWDDHEIANDSWKAGAENHQPDSEGAFEARRQAALKAYLEWMPIRETALTRSGRIFRSFDLGSLATLVMMDTRITGRDKPFDYAADMTYRQVPFDFSNPEAPQPLLTRDAYAKASPQAIKPITVPFDMTGERPVPITDLARVKKLDPKNLPKGLVFLPDTDRFKSDLLEDDQRSMIGQAQEDWLRDELSASVERGARWQLLGQQVLMGKLNVPQIDPAQFDFDRSPFITRDNFAFFQLLAREKMPLNLDAWDGYPASRERVLHLARETGANLVSLAGDTHNAWGFTLEDDSGPVGVEVGTPGVSSPGLETYLPLPTDTVEKALKAASPELTYVDAQHRGWTELDISKDHLTIEWRFVSTVVDKSYQTLPAVKYRVKHGETALEKL